MKERKYWHVTHVDTMHHVLFFAGLNRGMTSPLDLGLDGGVLFN